MNYHPQNITPEAVERLPAFVLAGLPRQLQDAVAALRRARSEAADHIERLMAAPVYLDRPPESVVNLALDPGGRAVACHLERISTPGAIAAARALFVARHLVADEIEHLMAVLDELDGDDDLELNLAGDHWNPDPRLDDAEGDAADDEPTISDFDGEPVHFGCWDLEYDPSESGMADLDGLTEQFGSVER